MKPFVPGAIGRVVALLAFLALTGPFAAAGAGEDRTAIADPRVSMSPEEAAASTTAAVPPPTARKAESGDEPPLTRAAARRRVETISPVPWLARFGPVSLESRN